MRSTHTYSKPEEFANALTHGIGVLLSIAALCLLVSHSVQGGTAIHLISFSIYGGSMFLLYISSTLLHSLPEGKAKDFLEKLDHASIYMFIAGSYTPILLLVVKGSLGFTLLCVVWAIALLGIIFKIFFTKQFIYLSTSIYLLMGWLIVFAFDPIVANLATTGLIMLVIGGVLYTLGTIFYMWRLFPYHHAVWHLFVVGGSAFHFLAMFYYILPIPS